MSTRSKLLFITTAIILSTFFLFWGLSKAKGFFAPLFMAVILSLIVLPLSQRMERKMNRSYAALLNSLLLFLLSLGFFAIISFQVRSLAKEWPQMQEKMQPKIEQLENFALKHTPLSRADIKEAKKSSGTEKKMASPKKITTFLNQAMSFLANYLLTFIYVFFLLNYRRIFKDFLLNIFSDSKRDTIKSIISESIKVAPQYLIGRLMLIGFLVILYGIGLGISGVSNFILVSVIAALLTLIPYVGNLIAFLMAVVFGFLATGDTMTLVGIALTFTIAQFVESYVLEPYVVGDRVDVHPFFVILAVVLGNMVWGVIGMILAIPVLGILSVVLTHIEDLRPFGVLLSKKKASTEKS
ncbi:AI-2E family transporter [Gramella sp. KN1008]|uniref:AI-2E family transporter n=1 Tax=Gramella sp. KN1008 TaxID=2529298 RepID=UPI00103BC2C4|nr:AI-2E family transporter [Gramella sp. KN1008]TBW29191.1 AI-2E family transporter [Gramella sp. KN1008]